jgi:hypothetical protein
MIEFACDTAAFSDLRLTEALGTIARLGFRYADLDLNQHLNVVKIAADPRRISAELLADLRVYNLKLANVSLTLPSTLLSTDETESQSAFEQFTSLLPLFEGLDISGITIAIEESEDSTPDAEDEETSEEDRQQHRIDVLRRLQKAAEPLALRIRADDVHFFDDLDSLSGLGLTLDAATLVDDEVQSELLSRTRLLTIRAASGGLSRDEAVSLMQTLLDSGYDGVLSVGLSAAPMTPAPTSKSAPVPTPISATRRILNLRDTLRAARDQVIASAKKPVKPINPSPTR